MYISTRKPLSTTLKTSDTDQQNISTVRQGEQVSNSEHKHDHIVFDVYKQKHVSIQHFMKSDIPANSKSGVPKVL